MVFVFAKTPDDSLASLVKAIDKKVGANKKAKIAAVINFTGSPNDAYLGKIKELAKKHEIKNVALSISADGGRFKVNNEADITVMHYKGKKVKFNFAGKGELAKKDVEKIVEGIDSILK